MASNKVLSQYLSGENGKNNIKPVRGIGLKTGISM
jgi:hypothetical protein